jgi:hypothetical protein
MSALRTRTQEISAEYWDVRKEQSERVAVAQLTLALAAREQGVAEAIAAERARIAEAVRGLDAHPHQNQGGGDEMYVLRAAVLAIVEAKPEP